jgi:hypothetical protein
MPKPYNSWANYHRHAICSETFDPEAHRQAHGRGDTLDVAYTLGVSVGMLYRHLPINGQANG